MNLSPSQLQAATRAIADHQRILVIPHANVDPDGLSSALACHLMFGTLGKDVTVVCPDTLGESLAFLPGFDHIAKAIAEAQSFIITINLKDGIEIGSLRYSVEESKVNIIVVPEHGSIKPQHIGFAQGERPYDLIVVVDTADLALLGSLYSDHIDLFSDLPILNVDHHVSNTRFGQVHLIDPTCASATEVLTHWFRSETLWREKMTPDLATLLLTGLITDTRSFQNPNTTPRSLEVAAELLERGARQQEIIQHIYKTKPLSTLKIWGRALNRIQIDSRSRIVWSSVSREDLKEMEAQSSETHGILDELISTILDADVHVLFTETEDGTIKASLRSSSAIDASRLAAECFGGGGHTRAAGFRVVKPEGNFQLTVVECVQKLSEGMERQRDVMESGPGAETAQPISSKPAAREKIPAQKKEQPPQKSTDVVKKLSGNGQA